MSYSWEQSISKTKGPETAEIVMAHRLRQPFHSRQIFYNMQSSKNFLSGLVVDVEFSCLDCA